MSSFNLYDILPDKSKEALQSLFKSEDVVQAKPKPQPKLMPKKKNPTTVVKKKSSKASQLFRPLQGKHKAVWNAMTSNDVPERVFSDFTTPLKRTTKRITKRRNIKSITTLLVTCMREQKRICSSIRKVNGRKKIGNG